MATITSPASSTSSVTPSGVTSWWLKDPATPSRNSAVKVSGWERKQSRPASVYTPQGRSRKIVLRGPVLGDEGTLRVNSLTEAQYDALESLLNGQSTLLLQDVMGQQWYVEVAEDIQRTQRRAAPDTDPYAVRHYHEWEIPLVEVDPP